jgi:hypothetical protein
MRFQNNPWIDPRIVQIKPSDAELYLRHHGWIPVDSSNPHMKAFASSANPEDASVVCVPQLEQATDYAQRTVEFVGDLATIEDRYAGDVLSDILQAKSAGNGAAQSQAAHSAAS